MKKSKTTTGVHLMPIVLLASFIFCLYIGAMFYAGFCFFLAVVFWLLLWSENKIK